MNAVSFQVSFAGCLSHCFEPCECGFSLRLGCLVQHWHSAGEVRCLLRFLKGFLYCVNCSSYILRYAESALKWLDSCLWCVMGIYIAH